ncbi:MAG: tetratricopeptide repeat protein [Acidobacteria bacterium]|nr:tetratricopeptide repeat protein [Acidobacteriota bacterium]
MGRRKDTAVMTPGRDDPPAGRTTGLPGWLRRAGLPAGLLVALTFAAYVPALRAGFVWDDDVYVTANPHHEDPAGLRNIWLEPRAILAAYPGRGIDALIPLTFTTLWVEHRLWGVEPLGYHAVNVGLHALAAVLLWSLLRRLRAPGAWLAAAMFAVHPVMVESVAWVAELKNVQSGVLALLCLLAVLRFAPPEGGEGGTGGRRRRTLVLALLLFAAALLSKSAVVALPVVVALVIWWKRGRLRTGDLAVVAPMLAMAAAMGLLTLLAERPLGAVGGTPAASLVERALVAGRALWFYVGKLLWPVGLSSIYPRWEVDATVAWQVLYPMAAVAAIAALWLLRGRWGRGPLAAALCFAALVAPTTGIFAVNYHLYSFVADHFQYHAAPALLALLAAGLAALWGRTAGVTPRWMAAVACALLLLVLGSMTFRHAQAFTSEKARCLDTIAKNPAAWLAHNNLGVALNAEGNARGAVEHFRTALRLRPGYAEAHNNLGVALAGLGELEAAAEAYAAALRIRPDYAAAHNNLGAAQASAGKVREAIPHYREAVRIRPDYAEARTNLGRALLAVGETDESFRQYREALRVRPGYAEAHNDLGLALAAAGPPGEAVERYREALRLKPDYAEAANNLGAALASAGDAEAAIPQFETALRIRPDYPEARNNLGRTLASRGRTDEAIVAFREAVRLKPDYAEAHNNLGTALASRGALDEAIGAYREAVRLAPGDAEAHANLGAALTSAGRLGEAVGHLEEALRLEPDLVAAHNALGVALASAGRLDLATPHFERALALDPANADARRNLERARMLRR